MRSRVFWIVQVGCAAWIGLTVTWEAARGTDADKAPGPPLKPKPYQVGIAPSHITKPTAPLFGERVDDWDEVRNNIDFYKDLNTITFLREIGKHFRVSGMLSRDSVKSRMVESESNEGISFTEFSYQVL